MSETPEPTTPPASVATAPPARTEYREKPPLLYRVAAWVVIVAGIVFIASTLLFTGAMIFGAGQCYQHRHYHHGMFRPDGPGGPGGPGWQFRFPGGPPPPGMGPGFPGGPPGAGTGQTPTSGPSAPSTAPGRP
ncbi:hypothetical protein ACX9NE_09895 [Mycobacterium sp. ML4]